MRIIFCIIFVFFSFNLFSQKILVIEKPGTVKNFKYYPGNSIKFAFGLGKEKVHYETMITNIYDDRFTADYHSDIFYNSITTVYRDQRYIKIIQYSAFVMGGGYLILDVFNRAINNDSPVFDESTMIISGVLIGVGLSLFPFKQRQLHIGDKWQIKGIIF